MPRVRVVEAIADRDGERAGGHLLGEIVYAEVRVAGELVFRARPRIRFAVVVVERAERAEHHPGVELLPGVQRGVGGIRRHDDGMRLRGVNFRKRRVVAVHRLVEDAVAIFLGVLLFIAGVDRQHVVAVGRRRRGARLVAAAGLLAAAIVVVVGLVAAACVAIAVAVGLDHHSAAGVAAACAGIAVAAATLIGYAYAAKLGVARDVVRRGSGWALQRIVREHVFCGALGLGGFLVAVRVVFFAIGLGVGVDGVGLVAAVGVGLPFAVSGRELLRVERRARLGQRKRADAESGSNGRRRNDGGNMFRGKAHSILR